MNEEKNLMNDTDLSHMGGRRSGGSKPKARAPGSVFNEHGICTRWK